MVSVVELKRLERRGNLSLVFMLRRVGAPDESCLPPMEFTSLPDCLSDWKEMVSISGEVTLTDQHKLTSRPVILSVFFLL